MSETPAGKGFWDHLDDLRNVLIKIAVIEFVSAVVLFIFMKWIMDVVILAPCSHNFPLYSFLGVLNGNESTSIWLPNLGNSSFNVTLINIELASQFFLHISLSCWLALILTFPIIIFELWTFVRPGLYAHEREGAVKAFTIGNLMFFLGIAVGYFIVFPLTLHFLADYQLSERIPNTISINSYIDNFLIIILLMGMVFELPLLAWLLGKMKLLTRSFFRRYRRHAIVILLIMAAIITPTGDPFTLFMVFIPIYFLWECSAFIVPK